MELSKIKVGRYLTYTSRTRQGRGKVTDVYTKATGAWVTLHDNSRDVVITVRPSQVSAR